MLPLMAGGCPACHAQLARQLRAILAGPVETLAASVTQPSPGVWSVAFRGAGVGPGGEWVYTQEAAAAEEGAPAARAGEHTDDVLRAPLLDLAAAVGLEPARHALCAVAGDLIPGGAGGGVGGNEAEAGGVGAALKAAVRGDCASPSHGGLTADDGWAAAAARYEEAGSPGERNRCLQALAAAQTPELLQRTLAFAAVQPPSLCRLNAMAVSSDVRNPLPPRQCGGGPEVWAALRGVAQNSAKGGAGTAAAWEYCLSSPTACQPGWVGPLAQLTADPGLAANVSAAASAASASGVGVLAGVGGAAVRSGLSAAAAWRAGTPLAEALLAALAVPPLGLAVLRQSLCPAGSPAALVQFIHTTCGDTMAQVFPLSLLLYLGLPCVKPFQVVRCSQDILLHLRIQLRFQNYTGLLCVSSQPTCQY